MEYYDGRVLTPETPTGYDGGYPDGFHIATAAFEHPEDGPVLALLAACNPQNPFESRLEAFDFFHRRRSELVKRYSEAEFGSAKGYKAQLSHLSAETSFCELLLDGMEPPRSVLRRQLVASVALGYRFRKDMRTRKDYKNRKQHTTILPPPTETFSADDAKTKEHGALRGIFAEWLVFTVANVMVQQDLESEEPEGYTSVFITDFGTDRWGDHELREDESPELLKGYDIMITNRDPAKNKRIQVKWRPHDPRNKHPEKQYIDGIDTVFASKMMSSSGPNSFLARQHVDIARILGNGIRISTGEEESIFRLLRQGEIKKFEEGSLICSGPVNQMVENLKKQLEIDT